METDRSIQWLLNGLHYKKLLENKICPIQEKYGLRKVDIEVLYYLTGCGAKNTARDIREEMNLTKGHISQAVDRMQKMHILEPIIDETDRRCVHLTPTENGKALMGEIKIVWDELNQSIFGDITEAERQVLRAVALKIKNNLEKELK